MIQKQRHKMRAIGICCRRLQEIKLWLKLRSTYSLRPSTKLSDKRSTCHLVRLDSNMRSSPITIQMPEESRDETSMTHIRKQRYHPQIWLIKQWYDSQGNDSDAKVEKEISIALAHLQNKRQRGSTMIVGMAFDHQAHEQTTDIDKHLVKLGQGKRVTKMSTGCIDPGFLQHKQPQLAPRLRFLAPNLDQGHLWNSKDQTHISDLGFHH